MYFEIKVWKVETIVTLGGIFNAVLCKRVETFLKLCVVAHFNITLYDFSSYFNNIRFKLNKLVH